MFKTDFWKHIDIPLLLAWLTLSAIGIFTLYSAVYYSSSEFGYLSLKSQQGKQFWFLMVAIALGVVLFISDNNLLRVFSYYIYGFSIVLLIAVLFIGAKISGSRSWFVIGPISFQPSEFAKYGTALATATYASASHFKFKLFNRQTLILMAIVFTPALLIALQGDKGSALVFASFIFLFYRIGLPPSIPILIIVVITLLVSSLIYGSWVVIGVILVIAFTMIGFNYQNKAFLKTVIVLSLISILFSAASSWSFHNLLEPHQKDRISATLGIRSSDTQGKDYNVNQSKIAIGAGGFWGQGYLNGTHTKGRFVPEHNTDFIFCTIGEEFGWIGSTVLLLLFTFLVGRLIFLAEKQSVLFSKYFFYAVAGYFIFHVSINIGMTLGLVPVIGIPLPLISKGGSSILVFSLMIISCLRLNYKRRSKLF